MFPLYYSTDIYKCKKYVFNLKNKVGYMTAEHNTGNALMRHKRVFFYNNLYQNNNHYFLREDVV